MLRWSRSARRRTGQLYRHGTTGLLAPVIGPFFVWRAHHLHTQDIDRVIDALRHCHAGVSPTRIKGDALLIKSGLDSVACFVHLLGVGRIMGIGMAEGHTHVAWTPFGKANTWDGSNSIDILKAMPVFNLQTKQ